jgi:hypothetical protein
MLFVGFQFVIWSATGAYMVIFDIDYIHGDGLVSENQAYIESDQINYSLLSLYSDYPQAQDIELLTLVNIVVYRFNNEGNKYLLSADTGKSLTPLSESDAVNIAKYQYNQDDATLYQVSLITEQAPSELNAKYLPVWRIDFDDFSSPSFYISVQTGELVTKRHTFWRIFDWMFRFHVMDYTEGDTSNKLLLVFAFLSLVASIFGTVLIYFRLGKQGSNKKKRLVNGI